MNLGVRIKTITSNKEKIVSVRYTKKPCHLYKEYTCEMFSVTDEIERKSVPKTHGDIFGGETCLLRHEITRCYLYIPENPNDENKLVIKRYGQNSIEIDSVFHFLRIVFLFLLDAHSKGGIKGLEPLLFKVSDLFMMEADRRYKSQNIW